MKSSAPEGVSVIICCYNSASRLPSTLTALSNQSFTKPVKWEIVLVDNASTDSTALIAQGIWDSFKNKPDIGFRIVSEKKAGQAYARRKGISSAFYKFALFCDDDNWMAENYVEGVYDILKSDNSLAACGGLGIPVFETSKPYWFDEYAEAFAVGSQHICMDQGRILNLYGAGMAVNIDALIKLNKAGFQPVMSGRTGTNLSSSDDTELTYAFVLMGYRLHYAPGLSFSHFLPEKRLTISYLNNLFKAFGKDGPVRNLYFAQITQKHVYRYLKYWPFHLLFGLSRLAKYLVIPPKKNGRSIYFHWSIAYLRELLAIRKNYKAILNGIQRIRPAEQSVSALKDHKMANL